MGDWKCPFCGSGQRLIDTGFVRSVGDKNDFEKDHTFCCQAQKQNATYARKNFDADHQPDLDNVSKI